jgi:hypothetical protein
MIPEMCGTKKFILYRHQDWDRDHKKNFTGTGTEKQITGTGTKQKE